MITLLICNIPIIILWLIPKNFMIDQATGLYFIELNECLFDMEFIISEVSKFRIEYERSYYKDLMIYTLFLEILFIVLITLATKIL